MGAKNLDRLHASDWYAKLATVHDFLVQRVEVIADCRLCHLQMVVDLGLIERERGPKLSLWDRTVKCRRIGCSGRMDFKAKFPGKNHYERIETDPRRR